MDTPSNHHGMERPAKKKLSEVPLFFLAAHQPIPKLIASEAAITIQSNPSIMGFLYQLPARRSKSTLPRALFHPVGKSTEKRNRRIPCC
jgi:hypothetical protein